MIRQLQKILYRRWRRHQKLLTGNNYKSMSKKSLLTARRLSDGHTRGSGNVPKGSIAVYVGPELRRFVIPTSCLTMLEFKDLMDMVAEEFGFQNTGELQFHVMNNILRRYCLDAPLNRMSNNRKIDHHLHILISTSLANLVSPINWVELQNY